MKRFISYGSIGQFRNAVRAIREQAQFVSYDKETDKVVMDKDRKPPILPCVATEKIHGTNASVCYSKPDGLWVQSRKNIITVERDNAGCAAAVEENREAWLKIIKDLAKDHNVDLSDSVISIYFEWCGGSIQKKSAVSGLNKRAIIFNHFKVSPLVPEDKESSWLSTNGRCCPESNIFNVSNFSVWKFDIDFSNPSPSVNKMIKIVEEKIEPSSPLGEAMGIKNNTGEGIVVTTYFEGVLHRFKVKGEKHSKSKVKKLKPVDEKFEAIKIDFVNNYAYKASRLEQAWQEVFGIDNEKCQPDITKMGDFLRCVFNDVLKEESDIMEELGLEPKKISGSISSVAREWFKDQLDEYYKLK